MMWILTQFKILYPWLVGVAVAVGLIVGGADMEVAARGESLKASVEVSGLLTGILLGLLAIVMTLDSRPIIKKIKDVGLYPQLVRFAIEPLVVFVIVAVASIVFLIVDIAPTSIVRSYVAIATSAATIAGLLATLRVAIFIYHLLVDVPATRPKIQDSDSPEAARSRLGHAAKSEASDDAGRVGLPVTP